MFINVQTGDAYVSAEKKTVYKMDGQPHQVYILTREDGSTKEVSETAFKAWFQEDNEAELRDQEKANQGMIPMPGTEDPDWGKKAAGKKTPNDKHAAVAKKQLEYSYNWIVGGYINTVQDGEAETMPPVEDMFDEVMDEATTHLYGEGMCSQKPAPAAMRFVGKRFLIDTLTVLFQQDGYEVPACCTKIPEKKTKQGTKREYKDTPDSVGEDEVVMRAFTGMLIGVFKIVKKTKTYIAVETARGQSLKFDKKTGIQMDAKNPKFANRIEI
jgi:hypothetical protein